MYDLQVWPIKFPLKSSLSSPFISWLNVESIAGDAKPLEDDGRILGLSAKHIIGLWSE